MATYNLNVNGVVRTVNVADSNTPLLWVLRDLGLTGTKYGCGIAKCQACTIWIDGSAEKACEKKITEGVNVRITTIEGLAADRAGKALQDAFIAEQVPQCGYCQSGMLMRATKIVAAGGGSTAGLENICACGTYPRVVKAINRAVAALKV